MTVLDIGLILFMLLSGALALMRGFTREIMTIVAWGSAAGAALYAYMNFRTFARAQLQSETIADVALVGGTFAVVLVVVSLLSMKLSDVILDSKVGAVDRTLGFAFGLGRGLLLAVIAFQFYVKAGADEQRQPGWIRDAQFRPLLEDTGEQLLAALPEDLERSIFNPPRQGGEGAPASEPEAADGAPEQR